VAAVPLRRRAVNKSRRSAFGYPHSGPRRPGGNPADTALAPARAPRPSPAPPSGDPGRAARTRRTCALACGMSLSGRRVAGGYSGLSKPGRWPTAAAGH